MITIKGDTQIGVVKRLNVDAKITMDCIKCGSPMTKDFKENYLPYPEIGDEIELYFCCDECDTEHIMPVKVKSCEMILECNDDEFKVY